MLKKNNIFSIYLIVVSNHSYFILSCLGQSEIVLEVVTDWFYKNRIKSR